MAIAATQESVDPAANALVAEAVRDLAQGNAEGAIAALSAASMRNPDYMPVNFMTALLAWQLGDTAKSLALARRCFEQAPMNGTVAEILASLYAQTGDLVESLCYGKLAIALEADPVLSEWLPANFPAFDVAFMAIQEKPLLGYARSTLAAGHLDEALDKARQHVEVAPADDDGRRFYGVTLLRAGSAGAALETLSPLATRNAPPVPAAASALGRAFAAVGEPAMARHWHDAAVSAAPKDAAIAAARIADAPWLGVDRPQHAAWRAAWLSDFVQPAKPRQRRAPGDKLVIGYLVSAFADRQDAAAVAAVARAHARSGTTVMGYGIGAQSWNENVLLRGAFDKWRDIDGVDPATLAKTFAVDGVDVVIDVGGVASAVSLQALARVNTALRVAWLCDSGGLEGVVYDAVIAPPRAPASIEAWQACGGYPLLRDWTRPRERTAGQNCRFGTDVRLCQLDETTTRMWRAMLEASPDAALLIRANDMATAANVDRLVERFGTALAARIDVVEAAAAEDFYRLVDIALAPVAAVSARTAGEALACGVPVLALDDGGLWQPHAPVLRHFDLADLAAADKDAYVAMAAALAGSAERRDAAAARVAAIAGHGECLSGEIAAAIEAAARMALGRVAP